MNSDPTAPPPFTERPCQTPRARLFEWGRPTINYCMQVEVHVYALSVAASILLSFFPFLIVMVSLCKYLLEWPAAVKAI